MFRFKQFTIRQDRCPMKVGTDGVLLGAWAGVLPQDKRILDIGTGTGLIALMMAQRAPGARIVGVDVEDVSQARENADASPWGGRVAFVRCPVQEFAPQEPFDLVVSNPPFFVDSLTCPDAGRTTARHAVRLPFDELCHAVVRLLADGGRFALILPADEAARFLCVSRGRLVPVRRTDVRTTPRHPVKRVLLEFIRQHDAAAFLCGSVSHPATPADPVGNDGLGPSPADVSVRTEFFAPTSADGSLRTKAFARISADASVRNGSGPSPADVSVRNGGSGSTPADASVRNGASGSTPADERFFSAGPFPAPLCDELVIGTGEHEQYTSEYRSLTRDFYLKF